MEFLCVFCFLFEIMHVYCQKSLVKVYRTLISLIPFEKAFYVVSLSNSISLDISNSYPIVKMHLFPSILLATTFSVPSFLIFL